MKHIIRKWMPKFVIACYHLILAWMAVVWYRHPSEKIVVVGVTGTSGKSSVIYFLRQMLEAAGWKVGALSTVEFCVAGKCHLNDKKMTMLGRMQTQKFLRDMVRAGCKVAIVETTSEGYLQHRHRFINYDIMVLTNLYPEHLEAHGGFENYKAAKLGIFKHGAEGKRKTLSGGISEGRTSDPTEVQPYRVEKVAIVNGESEYVDEFFALPFDKKITFTAADALPTLVLGEHTPMNVAAALTVARELHINESILRQVTAQFKGVPGRIELIPEAEAHGFRVIVDYAFEPVALATLYNVVEQLKPKRVIHVLGSCGGGRDRAIRPVKGRFVAQRADVVIVTNEDPYDDEPMEIIEDVAKGAETVHSSQLRLHRDSSATPGSTVHSVAVLKILDRREAIGKALALAQPGDVVLITGKASEQAMVVKGGKKIPWDDRKVVRDLLQESRYVQTS